jgi:hypothetical protein
VGLLELAHEGLLDEGGVYVAEVEVVVHQVGVVSYDGCFHLLERLMVCEESDPDLASWMGYTGLSIAKKYSSCRVTKCAKYSNGGTWLRLIISCSN